LKNVSKKFLIGSEKKQNIILNAIHFFSGREAKEEFWALKDISLTVNPGEIIGIVGSNGAGKSTLLSLIADIYKADEGSAMINGRVISITGLIHGIHDKLNMKENIILSSAFYGLTQKQIQSRTNSIIKFAELEKYPETKIHQFSTGMRARLIFSIAIHCDPDILLLDEVTSNLDKEFTKTVSSTVRKLTKKGVTVIIVSHKKEIIADCDRAIILDEGKLIKEGTPSEIIKSYWETDAYDLG
jgi:ABC-type polysaccharide/polyol phosphate transport system ATPase subunit